MRHPTDGTLRRLLDEPAGVADAVRDHVAACSECRVELESVQEDAAAIGAALAVDFDADVDAAWLRLSSALAAERRPRAAAATPRRQWRTRLRSPRVVAVAAAALLAGAGAAAAADWLQIFRTERIAPIRVTQADLLKLPDLGSYGDLDLLKVPKIEEVDDAAAAQARTGLSIPQVSELPRGVKGEPTFQVGGQVVGVFTFSAEQAGRVAADQSEVLPTPPPGMDGSQFRLSAGPGLAMTWSEARGVPAMVVARAVAPTAASTGIPFTTARDYLLTMPGLPEDVAAQLRRFSGDGKTLPLPVDSEQVESSAADVGGAPATVLTARDGTMAGVIWVADGVVNAVAGSLSADEVLSVARGLRWSG
jgi:hypothetical protein